ncbi:hypothetical protein ONE63_002324 [Megalurothrips usitatus]|uniref:Cc8L18.2-like protein n=1 Tax=Megalurothrips usitatus TaxID=439358 RepID=A0AAV7XBD1_9NEOP|nr:hypothetical protein ONE63_002324 [Megalurothrips usitatus]
MHIKSKYSNKFLTLTPGKKLCKRCFAQVSRDLANISSDSSPSSSQETGGSEETGQGEKKNDEEIGSSSEYLPSHSQEAIKKLNASLALINESPVLKRKLSSTHTYAANKLHKLGTKVESLLVKGGASPVAVVSEEKQFMDQTIGALKTKFIDCKTNAEKLMVLSIALVSLPQRKVLEIFGPLGATDYLIRKTSQLMHINNQGILPVCTPKKGRPLSDETVKAVKLFYEDDELASRVMPGKKDYVSVVEDGRRIQKQKRLVLCNLKELHVLFEKQTGVQISFSKFASLRPKHCVLAGASGTHTVCVCSYHQNFKLMNDACDMKECNEKFLSYKDVMASVLCDPPTSDCYLKACCPKCPGLQPLRNSMLEYCDSNLIENINYEQWTSTDRCSLESLNKTSEDFIETYIDQLKILLPHHYIAKEQAAYLKTAKEELGDDEVLTICDFAENYTCIIQDAIQSYYWSQAQVTLHPFCSYFKENGEVKQVSFTVISEYMKHNVTAVHTFQKKLIAFLKSRQPRLQKIKYFSDGAAQQYKNKFNIINLTHHQEDFQVRGEWHYFATSHGKGPCDGTAGALKREAHKASLQKTLIRNPREFYLWAKARQDMYDKTVVCFVTNREVMENLETLQPRYEKALKIPGIRSLHAVIALDSTEVLVKSVSSQVTGMVLPVLERKVPSQSAASEDDPSGRRQFKLGELSPGQYVTVLHEDSWIFGQVLALDFERDELLLSCAVSTRSKYKFQITSEADQWPFQPREVLTVVVPRIEGDTFILSKNDITAVGEQLNYLK